MEMIVAQFQKPPVNQGMEGARACARKLFPELPGLLNAGKF